MPLQRTFATSVFKALYGDEGSAERAPKRQHEVPSHTPPSLAPSLTPSLARSLRPSVPPSITHSLSLPRSLPPWYQHDHRQHPAAADCEPK